jgi:hypothetical protein
MSVPGSVTGSASPPVADDDARSLARSASGSAVAGDAAAADDAASVARSAGSDADAVPDGAAPPSVAGSVVDDDDGDDDASSAAGSVVVVDEHGVEQRLVDTLRALRALNHGDAAEDVLAGAGIVAYMGYLVKTAKLYGSAINVLGLGIVITLCGVYFLTQRSTGGSSDDKSAGAQIEAAVVAVIEPVLAFSTRSVALVSPEPVIEPPELLSVSEPEPE